MKIFTTLLLRKVYRFTHSLLFPLVPLGRSMFPVTKFNHREVLGWVLFIRLCGLLPAALTRREHDACCNQTTVSNALYTCAWTKLHIHTHTRTVLRFRTAGGVTSGFVGGRKQVPVRKRGFELKRKDGRPPTSQFTECVNPSSLVMVSSSGRWANKVRKHFGYTRQNMTEVLKKWWDKSNAPASTSLTSARVRFCNLACLHVRL